MIEELIANKPIDNTSPNIGRSYEDIIIPYIPYESKQPLHHKTGQPTYQSRPRER